MAARSLMLGCLLTQSQGLMMFDGQIHTFGPYFPKSHPQHWDSSWTQMTLRVKRGDRWTTEMTGRIIAGHLDRWLDPGTEYVMTHAPSSRNQCCASANLAGEIAGHMTGGLRVRQSALLTAQARGHAQKRCRTIAERRDNAHDRYQARLDAGMTGKTVLLVDDIVTTGNTMRSCMTALHDAGATAVIGIAMAQSALV